MVHLSFIFEFYGCNAAGLTLPALQSSTEDYSVDEPRIAGERRVFSHFQSMTAWQLTTGPERQFTCGPMVPWKERLRRVCEGTPPGFSFLILFFPFFVRALILSPLSRVMGNVYVFSRIKAAGCERGILLASLFFFFSFPFSYVLLF